MSDQFKENISVEEKLGLWRLQRENQQRHSSSRTTAKPLLSSTHQHQPPSQRRPVLRSLPTNNRERRFSQLTTPPGEQQSTTPLQNQTNTSSSSSSSKRTTPFSYHSSSGGGAASKRSSFRSRGTRTATVGVIASFMQPTTSSSQKSSSTGIPRPRQSLVPTSRRLSASLSNNNNNNNNNIQKRKSGGHCHRPFLSKPATRVTQREQQRPTFESDDESDDETRHYSVTDNEEEEEEEEVEEEEEEGDEQEYNEDMTGKFVFTSTPRLPLTSPLAVFSPPLSMERREAPLSSSTTLTNIYVEGNQTKSLNDNDYDCRQAPSDKGVPKQNSRDMASLNVDSECSMIVEKQLADEVSLPASSSKSDLDDELPALKAALDDFANLNLSFNLELSSSDDDEEIMAPSTTRISRNRSRLLGPILPIPSLREDLDENKRSPGKPSTPRTEELESKQPQPNLSAPSTIASPLLQGANQQSIVDMNDQDQEEKMARKPLRISRDPSRNAGLLFPISSLHEDLPDNKDATIATNGNSVFVEVDGSEMSRENLANAHLSLEIGATQLEIESNVSTRFIRTPRDRGRKLGPLLPIPSLRDELSDDKPDTPKHDVKCPVKHQRSVATSLPSFNTTITNTDRFVDSASPVECNQGSYNTESLDGPLALPSDTLQLEICSLFVEDRPRRRRRRGSPTEFSPSVFEKVSDARSNNHFDESQSSIASSEIVNSGATTGESLENETRGSPQYIDSIPLVKYRDRHILTSVPEEPQDTSVIATLQEQLAEALKENRQQAEKLARYHRTYEERVTPFRSLCDELREEKKQRRKLQAENDLVQEIKEKVESALKISFEKCQKLQGELQASRQRETELEQQLQNAPTSQRAYRLRKR